MRKIISFVLILIILTACEEQCGEKSQKCCEKNKCSESLVCNSQQICVKCGGYEEPCCKGNICKYKQTCTSKGICAACGIDGYDCCMGNKCTVGFCNYSGKCELCGGYNQDCCNGNKCSEGYKCNSTGKCEEIICGRIDQKTCVKNTCKGWLVPSNGVCKNPFTLNKNTNISICASTLRGHCDVADRDFCYWYGAYSSKHTSFCNNIEWKEMRDACLKGGNPNSYNVICGH
jgi:hypothetical protein